MLPTYEAILQPDGRLQFVDRPAAEAQASKRVLVIFIDEPMTLEEAPVGQPRGVPFHTDWHAIAGVPKD